MTVTLTNTSWGREAIRVELSVAFDPATLYFLGGSDLIFGWLDSKEGAGEGRLGLVCCGEGTEVDIGRDMAGAMADPLWSLAKQDNGSCQSFPSGSRADLLIFGLLYSVVSHYRLALIIRRGGSVPALLCTVGASEALDFKEPPPSLPSSCQLSFMWISA